MEDMGMRELMSLMEDVADFKYDSEEEVSRGPKKILPTETTSSWT
jgi:hypothetical protein